MTTIGDDRLLTEAELELMAALWDQGAGTVRDVMAALPPGREERAYTSIATLLRILEQKGFVTSEKDGRSHRFKPAISRVRYQARHCRHLVGTLFGGNPLALVRRLVESEDLSAAELQAMQALLAEKLEEE